MWLVIFPAPCYLLQHCPKLPPGPRGIPEWEFLGIYGPRKFPAEIPGNSEDFPKLSLDPGSSILRKIHFLQITFQ